jgi:endonuclease/exonuclease/phosphatase family metal-dependent hydrolase
MRLLLRALPLIVVLAGCTESAPLAPAVDALTPELHRASDASRHVTVLDWNLYIGADVDVVIGALASPDPADDLPALLAGIATLEETDFPSRAAAIADAIERARPEVVGLQEVWTIDIDLRPLGLDVVVDLDFLAILQSTLAARGLAYDVAAIVTNVRAVPIPGAIEVVDHDAILVDPSRVAVTASVAQNFTNNFGPVAPGVTLVRGFVGITATIGGQDYAVYNTHLEPDLTGLDLATLRVAQAGELVAAVGAAPRAILMGDFNDAPGSLMHQVVLGAGFADAWAALRARAPGLTCCHVEDLSNTRAAFSQRIDYIFARGIGSSRPQLVGEIQRLGDVPGDRVPGPEHALWPSDHAGLLARLLAR